MSELPDFETEYAVNKAELDQADGPEEVQKITIS